MSGVISQTTTRWRPRGFLGVVHLAPMPGDPMYVGGGFEGVQKAALQDAEALVEGGADGLIVENFGSAPFTKGDAANRVAPHQVAAMALVGQLCKDHFALPVGVNCLRNDAFSALGVAAAARLDFIRVNVHTGTYLTDQGLIEGEAHRTLRYRRSLGAERVAILADVLVKHAVPVAPMDPAAATRDVVQRGLADAVIVTGSGTGQPVDVELLMTIRGAADGRPVLIGSGLTPDNVDTLAPHAEGAIVGTWLKLGGEVRAPVDVARVKRLSSALGTIWHPESGVHSVVPGARSPT